MEKKQILFIHGAQSFSDYTAFLEHLRTEPINDPLSLTTGRRWQSTFRESLEDSHEVYMPAMPNKQNAKYEEWKIWFERHHAFLRDGVVLIGHSQGGYFLVKYLTENTMPVRVKALYLLAAPFAPDDFRGEDGGDFAFEVENLPRLAEQVGAIHLFHSTDDFVVPYEHAVRYQKVLPQAEFVTFEDKNHFILEEFPELLEHIRSHT